MCFANGNLCPDGVPRNTMTAPDKYGARILSPISVPDSALSFPLCATDEQLLLGIWQWVDKLAEQKFAEAFQLTAQDRYYDWSPMDTRTRPSSVLRFACWRQKADRPRAGMSTAKSTIASLRFSLMPLDGEWSDLSATFEVVQHKHSLVLVLNDIRVF